MVKVDVEQTANNKCHIRSGKYGKEIIFVLAYI